MSYPTPFMTAAQFHENEIVLNDKGHIESIDITPRFITAAQLQQNELIEEYVTDVDDISVIMKNTLPLPSEMKLDNDEHRCQLNAIKASLLKTKEQFNRVYDIAINKTNLLEQEVNDVNTLLYTCTDKLWEARMMLLSLESRSTITSNNLFEFNTQLCNIIHRLRSIDSLSSPASNFSN